MKNYNSKVTYDLQTKMTFVNGPSFKRHIKLFSLAQTT